MIDGRMVKSARTLLLLITVAVICSLVLGMNALPASDPGAPDAPAAETASSPSVTCIPLGLYGDITTPPLMGKLSDSSDNLTFVGTTNGLYVIAPGGKLHHFIYSPFGVKHMALIDDITGDGLREVVVALNDTQVPALRCYDGATWEKLWQFAPIARIWDKLWVERQLIISNLRVSGDGEAQSLLITSGRRVLSIDTKNGTEEWRFSASSALCRMVTLADLNGDDADEVFVGSDDGHLFWLDASTGKVHWQTRLPEHDEADYRGMAHLVHDIAVLDEESGKVVVVSGDGWAQMYDLKEKKRKWETRVFKEVSPSYQMSECLLMSLTADSTEDGLPEILLTKSPSTSYYGYTGYASGKAALCDSTGKILWENNSIACSPMGVETGSFDGKPTFLQVGTSEITLIGSKDGESVLHRIPLDALNGAGILVKQAGGNGYLSFSSTGDVAAISATGGLLWHYPRIMSVKAESGSFVGDTTEDVLFRGEHGTQPSASIPVYEVDGKSMHITGPAYTQQGQDPETRLLHMMDGATRAMAWSYEVPYGEFKTNGGLKGIQVTPDLVGSDGIWDIIGYRQDAVFIFSGKDGTCSSFPAGQPITSLEFIRNGSSGNAIAVGGSGGLMIFDAAGTVLWTTASAEWIGDETGRFMALDDINSDNVSDLAIISNTKIVVLKSVAASDNYEWHLTLQAEADYSISEVELVPDADNDGVRELACIQTAEAKQQGGEYVQPPNPLLSQMSLIDGKEFFKVQLPAYWGARYDLACGDFNGDGYADSLFASYHGSSGGLQLQLSVLSGKDGATLLTHSISTSNYLGIQEDSGVPSTNIGDVDGDGSDDLAYILASGGKYEYHGDFYSFKPSDYQLSLQVYSVARDSILNTVPATPKLKEGYFSEAYTAPLSADVDGDGNLEVIIKVSEPSIPSYDPDARIYYPGSGSSPYLALIDVDGGRRLAGFIGFDTTNASLFETHQPGILGVAACGGACFLSTGSHLHITSPEDGARMGPTVGVKWDGSTDGDFSQVFVDGVRNSITNGSGSELFLARGSHTVLVRSVDDSGRISYSPSNLSAPLSIKVSPSPWKPVLLVASLFALIAIILLLFYARVHRTWRARRRATK